MTGKPSLSIEDQTELEETLEHFNAHYSDTVLLLARYGAGQVDATDANAVSVDSHGLNLECEGPTGTEKVKLIFDRPAASAADVQMALYSKLLESRTAAGDQVPETAMEREMRISPTLPTFVTSVLSVKDLSPNIREITLEGGLEDFEPLGGDSFIYLILPTTGMSGHFPDGFSMNDYQATPPDEQVGGAYYSIRAWNPADQTIAVWIVLHGSEGGVGGWVKTCKPGDEVAIWGPRSALFIDSPSGSYLFLTDESGLAAVASLIEQVLASDDQARISVIAETIDQQHAIPLPEGANVDLTWLYRGTDRAGTGGRTLEAVQALQLDPSSITVFGAGESREMTTVRKYLRAEKKLSSDQVHLTGYWRRKD